MVREVKFARSSRGGSIAYGVEGDGPTVVMTPLLGWDSFGYEEMSPGYRRFSSTLAQRCRLVQFDVSGVGMSSDSEPVTSLEDMVDDLRAVIESVGSGPVVVFGRGTFTAVAIELAAERPELVERLALYAPTCRTDSVIASEELEAMAVLARANWDAATRFLADFSSRPEFGDAALANAAWYQRSVNADAFARMVEVAVEVDVTDSCARVTAPTALFQPSDDARWVPENAQRIAAMIGGASLRSVPGGLHSFGLGDPAPLIAALSEFLEWQPYETRSPDSAMQAVLFSDIVGHTDTMARLGDERGRAVIREHDELTRAVLANHGGREIKTLGDGFMASFSSARRSVDAAIDLQQRLAQRHGVPIDVRIGIEAGEPIEEDGDLFGATVIRASRISALARAGEVLVSDTIRSLCSGKDVSFVDRGATTLKGFDEPTRIAAVDWRSVAR